MLCDSRPALQAAVGAADDPVGFWGTAVEAVSRPLAHRADSACRPADHPCWHGYPGGCRSFVHLQASRRRLPEWCLLAGAVSLYLAATCAAVTTGFWDRHPARTPGRFRRALARDQLPDISPLPSLSARVRKKASVFAHLPIGVQAHRRQKRSQDSFSMASFTGK